MPRLKGRLDLAVGEADELDCRARGLSSPTFTTTALIDTGASLTPVDPSILTYLALTSNATSPISAPGLARAHVPLYDVRIVLGAPQLSRPSFDVQVVGILPATPTVSVLIGRDILDRCTLLYDGLAREFSLWIWLYYSVNTSML